MVNAHLHTKCTTLDEYVMDAVRLKIFHILKSLDEIEEIQTAWSCLQGTLGPKRCGHPYTVKKPYKEIQQETSKNLSVKELKQGLRGVPNRRQVQAEDNQHCWTLVTAGV